MTSTRARSIGVPIRFLLAGGLNTAVTYGMYVALLLILPYPVAYTVAFIAGIGLSYVLNRFVVFRAGGGLRTMALFPLVYVVQYLVSLAVVVVWVEVLHLPSAVGPVAAIIVTIPLTYMLMRRLFMTDGITRRTADG